MAYSDCEHGVDSRVSEDLLVNIFSRMEEDPRHLAFVACVCRRFGSVVRNRCWRNQCMKALPTIVPDVLDHDQEQQQHLGEPAGGWASLFKLLVCCPGLENAGVLLDNWDFLGLERELADCSSDPVCESSTKRRRLLHHGVNVRPHLASGALTFSREQGNKLLASRFRTDSLYICDWPGCVHSEETEQRTYKIFRGIFKNFKGSQIRRNLRDLKAKKTAVRCSFCSSPTMWDMVTSFCLRRSLEYHDDGEPVVRAYVCDNGHVSGAWTEQFKATAS